MRAIAASSVLVYHVWLYGAANGSSVDLGPFTKAFDNLRAGVTLFFVLSGFLLFRPYVAAALRALPSPSTRDYGLNRALRILPAYWVILLAVAVLFERELFSAPEQLLANLAFLQNYFPDYIFGAGIVPSWSLAIEVVFYLSVPVLGAVAIRLAARGGLSGVAAAFIPVGFLVVVGFAAKASIHLFEGSSARVWSLTFLTHADWFAAGMALAVLRVLWEDGRLRLPSWWRPAALAAAIALGAGSAKLFYAGTLSRLEYQTPIALSCALILALVVFPSADSRFLAFLDSRPLFAAGLASYSLFLWHDPLVRGFREAGMTLDGRGGFIINLALIALAAGAASALTYRFVEKPALARKRSWQRHAAPSVEAEPMGTPGPTGERPLPLRERIGELTARLAGAGRGDIELVIPQRLEAAVDDAAFDSIFTSLLENALRYGTPPIKVVIEADADELHLVIEDRGRGVTPSFVPHLFEPFSRSEPSRREADGKGLGLAHAQRLAHDLGGDIRYEDVKPHGARFHVVLPLEWAETSDRAPSRRTTPSGAPKRISGPTQLSSTYASASPTAS